MLVFRGVYNAYNLKNRDREMTVISIYRIINTCIIIIMYYDVILRVPFKTNQLFWQFIATITPLCLNNM